MGRARTARQWIERLVAFDTTSAKSNLALIDDVAEVLEGEGARCVRIFSDDGAKANLMASLGPEAPGGVVLSGHTDVVPVTGQDWDSDPFTVVEREERVVGRGTADMKSFVGAALAAVPAWRAAGLRRPVHFALSYDEEVGCLGVRRMLPAIAEAGWAPEAVIVGEPTSMEVVTAHKGVRTFRTRVTGREAHASAPHLGDNAITAAARLVGFLRELGHELASPGTAETEGYEPPYPTINVGTIEGGVALNIVPRTCAFRWETRPLAGPGADDVRARLEAYVGGRFAAWCADEGLAVQVETEALAAVPAFAGEAGSAAGTLALRLADSNRTRRVSYGSEAGLFQAAGFDVVLCGPGDIADAHKPNESIALAQVAACERFLARLGAHLAAGRP